MEAPPVFDWGDLTLYAGLFEEDMGAPMTSALEIEAENGLHIVFRAFAGGGIIAMQSSANGQIPEPSEVQYGIVGWNGRLNRVEGSEQAVRELIWEQVGE